MDGEGSLVYSLRSQTRYSVREIISTAWKVTGHYIPAKEVYRWPGDPARLVASSAIIRAALSDHLALKIKKRSLLLHGIGMKIIIMSTEKESKNKMEYAVIVKY